MNLNGVTLALSATQVNASVAQIGAYATAQKYGMTGCPPGKTACQPPQQLFNCGPGFLPASDVATGRPICVNGDGSKRYLRVNAPPGTVCVDPCLGYQTQNPGTGVCGTRPCPISGDYRNTEQPYQCVPNPCCQ